MEKDTVNLRRFGITMGAAFMVIALIIFIRHKAANTVITGISAAFFILGIILPQALYPVHVVWMKLAQLLGWVNTRIILCVIFYLIFTPAGLLIRLFGKDFLNRKIEKNKGSYWHKHEGHGLGKAGYERQF